MSVAGTRPAAVAWATIDCVVFDMDGTLLDLHFDDLVWNDALPKTYAAQRHMDLHSARDHVRATLEQARGTLEYYCLDHWSRTFEVDLHAIEETLAAKVQPRPLAREFLHWTGRRGLRRVLATNAHPRSLARKLAWTGLGACFEQVVSSHEVGHPKEADGFWHDLARRCALQPSRTLFIDDNPSVLAAARRFGIAHLRGIARPDSRGPELRLPGFHCIDSFAELAGALVD